METKSKKLVWQCRRMAGIDQVTLQSMQELRSLRSLDPKSWAALSCPVEGLEFDRRTLDLLDEDHDGRIRMPEILDAVEWLCARLKDTADITGRPSALLLDDIDAENPEGGRLATTAGTVLRLLGKEGQRTLSAGDMADAIKNIAEQCFNGDGVFPVSDNLEEPLREFVQTGLEIVGGAQDASGQSGLNQVLAEALVSYLKKWEQWQVEIASAEHPVEKTGDAWKVLEKIRSKVDDFFLRCNLASYAPQAQSRLNCEELFAENGLQDTIALESIANMPLASVGPESVLPLSQGLNPVWAEDIRLFATLTANLREKADCLTKNEWQAIQQSFEPYGKALRNCPEIPVCPDASFAPAEKAADAVASLNADKVERLADPALLQAFRNICEQDLASAAAKEDILNLERLVLYYCNLHRLLMNFVSFHDFYSLKRDAVFRAGTLYMDGRSCQLCLPVGDIGKHSGMAGLSGMCLLYCECTRRNAGGAGAAQRKIVAVLTAGGDDTLVEGRNGVFVDNTGQDWDATLTKIVYNPISFRQAMWTPYKRLSQQISKAITKFAEARREQSLAATQAKVLQAGASGGAASAPFDMGRSVGIFAAVGIALGAIGTALGSIANALLSLSWWQYPLLLASLFIVISGPSMFLAWLKFRKRALGPLLEASGWAVNCFLPVNHKLGMALTSEVRQLNNLQRQSMVDPFLEEGHGKTGIWATILLVIALAVGAWLWQSGHIGALQERLLGVQAPQKVDVQPNPAGAIQKAEEEQAKQNPPVDTPQGK